MMTHTKELSIGKGCARAFLRFGRIGFWLQLVVGLVPVTLLIYTALLGGPEGLGTRNRFSTLEYLTFGSLLILVFTTIWFYRYIRIGMRLAKPDHGYTMSSIQPIAWVGVVASTIGIMFSVLVMVLEVSQLLLYFLRAPQAGVPVVQTTAGGPASWVSAGDILSLMGLITTMAVEIAVLAMSLWLLFLTTRNVEAVKLCADEIAAPE